jgi:ubiquinone/menaquinone biosynthesis C-methylase UbiE
MKEPKEIVREGYDRLSESYRNNFNAFHSHTYSKWISELTSLIKKNDFILELGCGDGIPVGEILSNDYIYTGIDISSVQIKNACQNVPAASFITGDMVTLNYPLNSFNAVIALYSIIHVPMDEQKEVLVKVYDWLRPGGYFLCTAGAHQWTGIEMDWIAHGVTMYWSHGDAESYSELFASIGFNILKKEFIPEKVNGHTLFLVQKPS